MTPQNSNLAREFFLLLVLATLWGSSYSFIKIGVETIPPITLIAARTLIAGGILLAVLRHRRVRLPRDRATWRRFFVQACLNSVVPFTLIAWAEQSVDAGLAVILNSATPIFTFLLAVLITHHEHVTLRRLFGVMAGLAGICLVIGVEALSGLGENLTAQLAIILATICYAGAAIFSKNFKGLDPAVPAAGSLISGAVILLPMSLVVDRPWEIDPSAASMLALLALSAFSTALAFVIYFVRPDAGFGRNYRASLSQSSDRCCDRHRLPRRKDESDGLDRSHLRHIRCRRHDDPGKTAHNASAKRVRLMGWRSATCLARQRIRHTLTECHWR